MSAPTMELAPERIVRLNDELLDLYIADTKIQGTEPVEEKSAEELASLVLSKEIQLA